MTPKKMENDVDLKRFTHITVEKKKEIIAKHENGVRVSDLARQYGKAKSTICGILKQKNAIKTADVAEGVTMLTKQRSQVLEEVEKLLLFWLNEKELSGYCVTETKIWEKALQLELAETRLKNFVDELEFEMSSIERYRL
ncbi:DNA binding HTH domain Psq-type [Trinorchestia longiramus]|nr:DNA binding HTH domain Psq-type [Trinorchestia longiramus]